jgi:lipoprotein-releasing system permease protein
MAFTAYFARKVTFAGNRSFSRAAVALAVLSISLGVAVMEIATSTVTGFEREITRKQTGFAGDIRITTLLTDEADTLTLRHSPVATRNLLRQPAMQSLDRLAPFAFGAALLKGKEGMEGVILKGFWEGRDLAFFARHLREGRLPQLPDTGNRKEILISSYLARRLQLKVASKARLYFLQNQQNVRARPVLIAGIYESGMAEIDRDIVVGDLRIVQRIRNWEPDMVQGYDVHLKQDLPPTEVAQLTDELNALLPAHWKARTIRELFPELFEWLSLQHKNVLFILILMTLAAVVNMSTAVLILILERTRTIGLLRALGATRQQIRRIFLWNAFYLITLGVALGNALALGLLALQDATGLVQMDPESYFLNVVPVAWVWDQFLFINLGVITVCTTAMTLPVLLVSRIRITRALKFE